MSARAKKWLVFGITVAVIAGVIGISDYIGFLKNTVPDDAVLGTLDVALVQIEPTLVLSQFTGQTTESTAIYVFRPDGGMSIGALDLEGSGGFYIPEPGSVYLIKDSKLYCCDVVDRNWKVTDRRTWRADAIFELHGQTPYISDNYKVYDHALPLIEHEDVVTWADFIAQVQQKIEEWKK